MTTNCGFMLLCQLIYMHMGTMINLWLNHLKIPNKSKQNPNTCFGCFTRIDYFNCFGCFTHFSYFTYARVILTHELKWLFMVIYKHLFLLQGHRNPSGQSGHSLTGFGSSNFQKVDGMNWKVLYTFISIFALNCSNLFYT